MPLDITFKPEIIQQLIQQSDNGAKEVTIYFTPQAEEQPEEEEPPIEEQIDSAKTQQTASQAIEFPNRRRY